MIFTLTGAFFLFHVSHLWASSYPYAIHVSSLLPDCTFSSSMSPLGPRLFLHFCLLLLTSWFLSVFLIFLGLALAAPALAPNILQDKIPNSGSQEAQGAKPTSKVSPPKTS